MIGDPDCAARARAAAWALIPAHDEAASIASVVARALAHVDAVYVVADGCGDGTAEAAREAGARVLVLPQREGKAAALRRAWAHLATEPGWDRLVLLDGDGQHDPDEIPALLAAAEATGAELVLGCRRFTGAGMPALRRWTNRAMSLVLSRWIGHAVADSQCGFRLVTRPFLESRSWRSNHFEIESEMVLHAALRGWRVAEVPISTIYRAERSKIQPWRDAWRWLRFLRREAFPEEPGVAF